jgi:histidinol phosphatase-like enzyme (inositol monophosphatase family)
MTSPSNPEITARLEFAVQIAKAAGDVTLKYFRRADLEVERKADQSPVTIADRSAEELLRARIGERYPEDGIVGEELGTTEGHSGYQWILDPIDGTKSFVHGVPLYTTLVAVLQGHNPRVGVIHAPAAHETVYAAKGGGCWYTSDRITTPQLARVSSVTQLSEALLLTTEIEAIQQNSLLNAREFYNRLQSTARLARTWGDGYGYLMVATGRADVMIDPIVNIWDAAPLQTVIEEAGGTFTDWSGSPTIHAGEAIATNGPLLSEVLGLKK